MDLDVVTVFHRESNRADAEALRDALSRVELGRFRWTGVDNRVHNRGFAAGCNLGASEGSAPIIGFLNPDTTVSAPFLNPVLTHLAEPGVVITGCRFDKPDWDLRIWGVRDWVCGAAMFVRRDFFESVGGFDERYFLYFEETDLIRQAEAAGHHVRSIELPLHHQSPICEPEEDVILKQRAFARSAELYREKWG